MNATLAQVEERVEAAPVEVERSADVEALNELSSIELAYVGGGTFVATFV